MRRAVVCVLLLSAVVYGQAPPTFEVASIRPSSPPSNDVKAGVRIAGAQVRFVSMSLKDYIGTAYGVKPQQIVGPDWLGQERFDLAATIPSGNSAAQIPQMMRALLADRFRMSMHTEKREFPVYVLGLAKDGPQFKPSTATVPAPETGEKAPLVNVAATGGPNGVAIDLGGGSSFSYGNNRFEMRKLTMIAVAEMLTRFVDRAVINQTGLTGTYDIVLDIAPDDFTPLIIRSAINAGVTLPPQALRLLDNANTDPLSGPLRDVGLTLESRKAPLEVVVVDAISQTPTEN
jgi:uncharacterized protein (TIGR03435 family)